MALRLAHRWLKLFSVLIAPAWLAACASHVDLGMGAPPASTAVVRAGPQRLTELERDFVTQVMGKGLYELEVSRLAAARAINVSVRHYAQTMVAYHTQMNGELLALMNARGMAAPHALTDDKAAKLQRLTSLPASDAFDNGYIRVVGIEDHQDAIATFEKARDQVSDPELRALIERTLPALRNHLSSARDIAGTLAG